MTSHLWITLEIDGSLQSDETFTPSNWMYTKPDNIDQAINSHLSEPSPQFRSSRDEFLDMIIFSVSKNRSSNVADYIHLFVEKRCLSLAEKSCSVCGCEVDFSFRVCRNCGGKVHSSFQKNSLPVGEIISNPYESYSSIPSASPDIECRVGEPDFVNPNSYRSIIQVIQNIRVRAGIKQYGGDKRNWLIIECDGLPYNTLRDIIANVWRCLKCNDCFFGSEAYNDHICFILKEDNPSKEFGWVLPNCGLLHMEMNAARSFVKMNWSVFTSTLGNVLGFKSPKAQAYLFKGSDHHKTWHFLEILYMAISYELVEPYVKFSLQHNEKATTQGYWKWSSEIENPNYIYMQNMVFTYLHALMMLRVGVRNCHHPTVQDALTKISHLFYGNNHPIYRNILYHDTLDKLLMPTEIKNLKEKHVSGSRTGRKGKMQGGDALLEEVNKDSKSWLKMSGILSEIPCLQKFG